MRFNKLAALLAASSLMAASTPALSASTLPSDVRASASVAGESELMDSGFVGFGLVFGLGLIAGYLLSTVLDGDDEDERVSP